MPEWFDPVSQAAAAADDAFEPLPAGANRRALIVDAALGVLAREGLTRLTMRRVSRDARVALGLANYHFASKAALLRAVAHEHQRRCSGAPVFVPNATPGDGRWLEAQCLQRLRQRDGLCVEAQLEVEALRSAELAAVTMAGRSTRSAALAREWGAACGHGEVEEGVGLLLQTLVDGLALRRAADPLFDLAAACRLAEQWALAGPHSQRSGPAARRDPPATDSSLSAKPCGGQRQERPLP